MKLFAVFYLLAIYSSLAYAISDSCCAKLERVLPSKVHYPGNHTYDASLYSYWSKQEQSMQPRCVLQPKSTQEVSKAVRALAAVPQCRFAIKSGGHMAHAGAANIDDGVTVDLGALTGFSINKGTGYVTIGPGLRWGEVYSKLAAQGLAVPGARSADVGVGGYLLGGGLGYFVPYGFGCDNVVAYKIVVASGAILDVDAVTHPALFRALKGGSSNFGLLVSFTLRTFTLGRVWAGNMIYPAASTYDKQLQAFSEFTGDKDYDKNAALQMSISFVPSVGVIFVNQPFYASPQVDPPVFHRFTNIQPVLQNQASLTTLRKFANEGAQLSPHGSRQMTWSMSFQNDLGTLHGLFSAFNDSISSIANVSGISWSITLEPLPNSFLLSSAKLGGNLLGLEYRPRGRGLVLCDSSFTWTNEHDDARIRGTGLKLLDDIVKDAERRGTVNKWVDLNHADVTQDPFGSYGDANRLFLRYVSKRYDPGQFFQKQLPGGFKLFDSI